MFRDESFRDRFGADLRTPRPGTVFQGNWDRIIVSAPVKPRWSIAGEVGVIAPPVMISNPYQPHSTVGAQ